MPPGLVEGWHGCEGRTDFPVMYLSGVDTRSPTVYPVSTRSPGPTAQSTTFPEWSTGPTGTRNTGTGATDTVTDLLRRHCHTGGCDRGVSGTDGQKQVVPLVPTTWTD